MPLGFSLSCMLLGFCLLYFKRRLGSSCVILGIVTVYLASVGPVARYLMHSLEADYLPVPISQLPEADAIVVLGGGVLNPHAPRIEVEFDDGDRVHYASKLYKAGKAPLLVISGGNVFHQAGMLSNADYTLQVIKGWGVAEENVRVEGKSRNTYENAAETARLIKETSPTILLVTSAFHMRRSKLLFEAQGFDVITASSDIQATLQTAPLLIDWLPDVYMLHMSTRAIHEYVGLAVYRWRGWLTPP